MASISGINESNVDELRQIHESSTEWGLRRNFILTNADKFPKNRLLCLSSCFINVEMYGAGYPTGVMIELKGLMEDLPDLAEHRQKVKERNQVKFVKAEQPQGKPPDLMSKFVKPVQFVKAQTKEGAQINESDKNQAGPSKPAKVVTGGMNIAFVKASDDYHSIDVAQKQETESSKFSIDISNQQESFKQRLDRFRSHSVNTIEANLDSPVKFIELKRHYVAENNKAPHKNSIELIHLAAQKAKISLSTSFSNTMDNRFRCTLLGEAISLGEGIASNKKQAKHNAYDTTVTLITKPILRIENLGNDNRQLVGLDEEPTPPKTEPESAYKHKPKINFVSPGQSTSNINKPGQTKPNGDPSNGNRKGKKRPHENSISDLSEFILLSHTSDPNIEPNAASVLHQSADFNRVPLTFNYRAQDVENIRTCCQVSLMDQVISQAMGTGQAASKTNACEIALEKLKSTNWTLVIKQAADTDESGFTRDEVVGELQAQKAAIPESNIGNKMLKMMGWSGGGMGKDGSGISEPVSVNSIIHREGLGLMAEKGISKSFIPQIKQILNDYAKSDQQTDMSFAPDFNNEERAIIHKEARKIGLKSHSHGSGDDRYLVVSRKRTAGQLLEHVMRSGGETSKYSVIPPGNYQS